MFQSEVLYFVNKKYVNEPFSLQVLQNYLAAHR